MVVTAPSYVTLFSGSATPDVVNTTDASAIELGVKFQTSVSGTVSGIRFYKSSLDTGTHTGELWTSTGTKLATATFTNETASGWQSVTFSTPVVVDGGRHIRRFLSHKRGILLFQRRLLHEQRDERPLTAPANGNGVYTYSGNTEFPTSTFSATNYWVDVMFNPSTANGQPVATNDIGPAVVTEFGLDDHGGVLDGQ